MDIDSQDEEFADLHVDFATGELDCTCRCYRGGDLFAGFNCCRNDFLKKRRLLRLSILLSLPNTDNAYLHALRQSMRDGELDHIIALVP